MSNLVRYAPQDGIEVLIDPETGMTWQSVTSYARWVGKAHSTISARVKREGVSTLVVPSPNGGYLTLLDEDTVAEWLIKDDPLKAKEAARAGIRVFHHKLAGHQISITLAQPPQPAPIKAPSQGQMLIAMAQAFADVEDRVVAIESKVEALEAEAGQYRDYSTIKGYCRKLGVKPLSPAWAQGQGKEAKRLTLASGLEIREAPDPTYGTVGSYPNSVLETMTWPLPQQYRLSEGPLSFPFE